MEPIELICSAAVNALNPPERTFPLWEQVRSDLDAIHRQSEDVNQSYFLGHNYLIDSTTVEVNGHVIRYDFLLQRIAGPTRWKPLCVCYLAVEESPCEADDEYRAEEYQAEEYREIDGRCFLCQTNAPRNCSECGIGVCDGCSFGKTMCKWCILDEGVM